MSKTYEVGKVILTNSEIEKIVSLAETYSQSPVIKITSNKNVNIFITNVSTNSFTINKSALEEVTIYYSAIER
jgi:Holliday junction resolvase